MHESWVLSPTAIAATVMVASGAAFGAFGSEGGEAPMLIDPTDRVAEDDVECGRPGPGGGGVREVDHYADGRRLCHT